MIKILRSKNSKNYKIPSPNKISSLLLVTSLKTKKS